MVPQEEWNAVRCITMQLSAEHKCHCIPLRVYGNGVSAPTLFVSVHLKLNGFTEYMCTRKSHEIPCGVNDGVRSVNRSEVTILGRVTLLRVS